MRVRVISSLKDAEPEDFQGKTAVVIHTLRLTSNIVTALATGASEVRILETAEETRLIAEPDDITTGEKEGQKIPSFDLGNSPIELTGSSIIGKRIVMTSKNGSIALKKAASATSILIACILNARACAAYALQLKRDITILCLGSGMHFDAADGIAAGMLVSELQDLAGSKAGRACGVQNLSTDDMACAMLGFYYGVRARTTGTLLHTELGRKLCRRGLSRDVVYCARQNFHEAVPIFNDGLIIRVL
ncbi:MAG: 2-phosphosulfolactate phosphatase [Gorillibacterium sp.]|nr:2-phosphosulfolactate phosphatase [Gorillibacterium sp.]